MTFYDFGERIEKETQFVIFGIPWDYLTSIDLPNSSIGPQEIRNASNKMGLVTELGTHIPKLKVIDIGDIQIDELNVSYNLNTIRTFVNDIYSQNNKIIPVMLGGDHSCSFPVIQVVGDHFSQKEDFGVLIFDAHLDLYQKWDKSVYSHATTSHRIYDLSYIHKNNFLIAGTRDIDIPELEFADSEKIFHLDAHLLIEGLDNYIQKIIDFYIKSSITNLYISIDIDAIDPSNAPGTGYAIPGGFSYRDIWKILMEITKNFNIIAFDLVEVAPNLDLKNKMTCNLAAKLIIEFITFISEKINK